MNQLYRSEERAARLARVAGAGAGAGAGAPGSVRPSGSADASFATVLVRNLAFQDWFIAAYFTLMLGAIAFGNGPGRQACLERVGITFACFVLGIVLTRGGLLPRRTLANELTYRMTIFLSVFLSYFQLREILPAVTTRALDAEILAFDLQVFGVEPSLAWDRFVTPRTTEWFSFFYFGYFFILSAHVLPMLFNAKNAHRLAHFALGIFFVFCTGHLVYMLVPGWGPYRHLAGHFDNELEGGLFWSLVKATVEAGGAQKDIFPSLHTAVPTYFAIFSYMHRRALPFRYTWPVMAFSATQIILATMFLRWHYLVDIVAGLLLATTAALLSYRIVTWERARRRLLGVAPIFTIFEWPWARNDEERGES